MQWNFKTKNARKAVIYIICTSFVCYCRGLGVCEYLNTSQIANAWIMWLMNIVFDFQNILKDSSVVSAMTHGAGMLHAWPLFVQGRSVNGASLNN